MQTNFTTVAYDNVRREFQIWREVMEACQLAVSYNADSSDSKRKYLYSYSYSYFILSKRHHYHINS